MAQRVLYPAHIEPLVQFVEETTPEHIVARTHDKLAAGTTVKDMLLASALAVVRSSDLPPGHHGGPLPCAILHGRTKMVDFLLKRGADPRQQAEALGLAARLGMLQTVRKLLAAGFDPNSLAWQGRTPLHHARNGKHRKVGEVLLAAGGHD